MIINMFQKHILQQYISQVCFSCCIFCYQLNMAIVEALNILITVTYVNNFFIHIDDVNNNYFFIYFNKVKYFTVVVISQQ